MVMKMTMNISKLKGILEAVLFASACPVALEELVTITNEEEQFVLQAIMQMQKEYESEGRGIALLRLESAYQLCTKSSYFEYVIKLIEPRRVQPLSNAALETLSVVAYNQPVTRSTIEFVRGVNSDGALGRLIERGLVEECGKLDTPGKPLIYKTTDEFLRCFGLCSIEELPVIDHVPLTNSQ